MTVLRLHDRESLAQYQSLNFSKLKPTNLSKEQAKILQKTIAKVINVTTPECQKHELMSDRLETMKNKEFLVCFLFTKWSVVTLTRHKGFLIKFRKFSLFHQINAMVTWNQAQRKGPPDQKLTPRTINHESKRHWLTNLVESPTRVFILYLRYNAV